MQIGMKLKRNGKTYMIVQILDFAKWGGGFAYKCHQCELRATEMGNSIIVGDTSLNEYEIA